MQFLKHMFPSKHLNTHCLPTKTHGFPTKTHMNTAKPPPTLELRLLTNAASLDKFSCIWSLPQVRVLLRNCGQVVPWTWDGEKNIPYFEWDSNGGIHYHHILSMNSHLKNSGLGDHFLERLYPKCELCITGCVKISDSFMPIQFRSFEHVPSWNVP